mgnify:CR=1 FL=1
MMFHLLAASQPNITNRLAAEVEEVSRSMGELDNPPQDEPGSDGQPLGPKIWHL